MKIQQTAPNNLVLRSTDSVTFDMQYCGVFMMHHGLEFNFVALDRQPWLDYSALVYPIA